MINRIKKDRVVNNDLIKPHDGELKCLLSDTHKRSKLKKDAEYLPRVELNSLQVSDLIMLGTGAFSPLEGFMNKADYESVLKNMRLNSGVLWPIPITLSVSEKQSSEVNTGQKIALFDSANQEIVADMIVEDKYIPDKNKEAISIYGTNDESHPGVKRLFQHGKVYIGGKVRLFSEGGYPQVFPQYARPSEVREIFKQRGWKTIVAFQTRNPIHRSHEYLTKVALEIFDGLFIHPIVGKLKEGDIPAEIRMECYQVLLDNYYPKDRVLLKVYPMEMRYAGPREAILHAIIRQNYGCSHIIIGRDHAGVGSFYGPFEAQEIFDSLSDDDLAIKPVKMDWTFWCQRCNSMASYKTCPHSEEDHRLISGTKLRKILSRGEYPPDYITRREVSDILIDYYRGLENK